MLSKIVPKIKILYIIDAFSNPYAGTEGQILKLIKGLNKEKINPHFVIFKKSEYLKNNSFPISVDILGVNKISSPLSWIYLYKYLLLKKKEEFKIAHIFFNDASILCPFFLKILNYKVIISRRDMGYWYSKLNLLILNFNKIFVDLVIANSEAVKKITIIKEGYDDCKVIVIYNGYSEIQNNFNYKKAIINETIIKPNEIKLVLVANIRPIKRITDAIIALQAVKSNYKNIALYIIGDGDKSNLIKLSNKLGLSYSVHLLGTRNDIEKLLPFFDIGILCSESEGFSNTIIEYCSKSLPVICTNVGGNPELIKHDINGFLYEVGDVEALANYIVRLVKNKNLRVELGKNGFKYVKENFSISKYIKQHENIYERLINGSLN